MLKCQITVGKTYTAQVFLWKIVFAILYVCTSVYDSLSFKKDRCHSFHWHLHICLLVTLDITEIYPILNVIDPRIFERVYPMGEFLKKHGTYAILSSDFYTDGRDMQVAIISYPATYPT
jgi:hypothetical protein